jgi:hypothetical protein
MIQVKVIDIFEYTVLVEYEDASKHLQRCFLHRELLPTNIKGQPALVHEEYMKLGIPASTVDLTLSLGETLSIIQVRELQDQMRRAGLWVREDYARFPKTVQLVLSRMSSVDATTILNAAARTPINPPEEM